ncbi:SRPBCC domain-containing protein [Brevibacillus sp. NPDC058079]|uniref:SRPBCC domain-containing protein n=1 Tax=Brevibacillus sp. NPDC058079 TaxID=3346330 RepID=UPI0036EB13CA
MRRPTSVFKDRERRELTIERIINLSPELAWEGWTQPQHIARWWGPRHWTTTIYEMDVSPGGIWRYSLQSDDGTGEEAFCIAVYQEVCEPSRLVYIDSFVDKDWNIVENSQMHTTVTFEEAAEGTKLRIVTRFASAHELDNAEAMGMIEGYTDAFDRLEEYIETLAGGHMNTFISKDGTKLAYQKHGNGPAIVLVSSAISDHRDAAGLAEQLAAHFMTEAVGIPAEYLDFMKADPSWKSMESLAHTLAYDGMIMGETQSGKPLPTDRWKVNAPTFIMTGENSGPFFDDAAKALAELLPLAKHQTLAGQDHSSVVMAPDILAKSIISRCE